MNSPGKHHIQTLCQNRIQSLFNQGASSIVHLNYSTECLLAGRVHRGAKHVVPSVKRAEGPVGHTHQVCSLAPANRGDSHIILLQWCSRCARWRQISWSYCECESIGRFCGIPPQLNVDDKTAHLQAGRQFVKVLQTGAEERIISLCRVD